MIPLPETKRTLQAAYKNLGDAGKTVTKVFEIGILPVALEILDKVFINIIEDYTHVGLPREAEALLLIEVDGPETTVAPQAERLTNCVRRWAPMRSRWPRPPRRTMRSGEPGDPLTERRRD